eukprot:gene25424-26621_t
MPTKAKVATPRVASRGAPSVPTAGGGDTRAITTMAAAAGGGGDEWDDGGSGNGSHVDRLVHLRADPEVFLPFDTAGGGGETVAECVRSRGAMQT